MYRVATACKNAYRLTCTQFAILAIRRANTVLFLVGVALLTAGMDSLSRADVKLAPYTAGRPPESASHRAPEAASNRRAPAAIGRFAPGAIGRQATFTQGFRQELLTNEFLPNLQNQPAETTPNRPAEEALNAPPQNTDIPYDDTLIRNSVGNLYKFIEGAFGALLVVGAGIGAIVAATFGAYKAAVTLLVVAVGAFILRAYVSLFFGTNYVDYEVGAL